MALEGSIWCSSKPKSVLYPKLIPGLIGLIVRCDSDPDYSTQMLTFVVLAHFSYSGKVAQA